MLRTNSPEMYVQVPRTAGTSLRNAVIEHHGESNVYVYAMIPQILLRGDRQVYRQDKPSHNVWHRRLKRIPGVQPLVMGARKKLATPEETAFREAKALIGHFTIDTFEDKIPEGVAPRLRTVVRDPLKRMLSHYAVVQRHGNREAQPRNWFYGHDPELPFADFALSEPVQNFQTQYTGSDPSKFELLGTTENLPHFLARAALLAPQEAIPHMNASKRPVVNTVVNDKGFLRDFEEFHRQDYEFHSVAEAAESHPAS